MVPGQPVMLQMAKSSYDPLRSQHHNLSSMALTPATPGDLDASPTPLVPPAPANLGGWQKLMRLYHTVKYLRPVQIYGRLWFKLHKPTVKDTSAPALRAVLAELCKAPDRQPSMTGPNSFEFLGKAGSCRQASDWNASQQEKLWLYNLHYFDDLTAVGAMDRSAWHKPIVGRWIEENPVGQGNGWEPYPLSLRLVNWMQWSLSGGRVPRGFDASLATQVRYLSQRIEWHLQGNHLFVNGKALMMAGLYFQGEEARSWLKLGWSIVERELDEEFLSDGAHFELSPMYHSIMLRDLIDLVDFSRIYSDVLEADFPGADARLQDQVNSAREWLGGMVHPDREISLFNDAAFGVAPSPEAVDDYARAAGLPKVIQSWPSLHHFEGSGHVRWQRDGWTAFLDVGAIGPDYLPGHAHADTLSFELSVGDERLIVDTGTGVYGDSPERLRQRGSQAHNVVAIDGQNSSEVWSGFRVARRASVEDLELSFTDPQRVSACHDGYRRLSGKVTVARTWEYNDGWLSISDTASGKFQRAAARYHFGEGVHIEALGDTRYLVRTPGGREIEVRVPVGKHGILNSTYHPRFGSSIPIRVLEVELAKGHSEVALQLRA